jgi:cation:H+ antiporter
LSFSVAVLFLGGLIFLLLGAELLVRGASRLAAALGIAPLVIGLTVVAWGTGSPELAVAIKAAGQGQPDLAIGNVVGSNIANILLILGVAALFAPLKVSSRLVRIDVPLMIGASVMTFALALDGRLTIFDGSLLVGALLMYTVWTIRESRRDRRSARLARQLAAQHGLENGEEDPSEGLGLLLFRGAMVVVGLGMLIKGSDWLVEGASEMAAAMGLSELVIGLTIVSIGTSLPELATSAVASVRGERDIAVGNAIGSNIFNLLAVLGVTSIVASDGIFVAPQAIGVDFPIMIVVAIACLPVFLDDLAIYRWNGALFVALYVCYMVYLVFEGMDHPASSRFGAAMVVFVIPLAALLLVAVLIRTLVKARKERRAADCPEQE